MNLAATFIGLYFHSATNYEGFYLSLCKSNILVLNNSIISLHYAISTIFEKFTENLFDFSTIDKTCQCSAQCLSSYWQTCAALQNAAHNYTTVYSASFSIFTFRISFILKHHCSLVSFFIQLYRFTFTTATKHFKI